MDLPQLIAEHGYWILALGALLEGETMVVLAGFAAHRGHLQPLGVFAVAACAGWCGDQFWFWMGRRHAAQVLRRFPALGSQQARLERLVARWPNAVVIGIRFAYGLRIAGPVLLGGSAMPAARFAALNAVGALVWAGLLTGVGWVFGEAAERLLGQLRHLEGWLLLGIAVAGIGWWWWRRHRGHAPHAAHPADRP